MLKMRKPVFLKIILLCISELVAFAAFSQKILIDSLNVIILQTDIDEEQKMRAYAELLDIYNKQTVYEPELDALTDRLITCDKPECKTLAYSNLAYAHIFWKNDIIKAYHYADSCMYYSLFSKNQDINALAMLNLAFAKNYVGDNSEVLGLIYSAYDIFKDAHNQKFLAKTYAMFFIYYKDIDLAKAKEYAKLQFETSQKINDYNYLAEAWANIAESIKIDERKRLLYNPSKFKRTKNQRDSSAYALRNALNICEQHIEYIRPELYIRVLLNTVQHYQYDERNMNEELTYLHPDSLNIYIDKTLNISKKYDIPFAEMQMYLSKAIFEMKQNNFVAAEKYFDEAILIIDNKINNELHKNQGLQYLHRLKSLAYQRKKDYQNAFDELQISHQYAIELWSQRYAREGQFAQAKYDVEEKEQEILLIRQKEKIRLLMMLSGIIILFLFVVFVLVFYKMSLNYAKQKEKLLAQEKEEAFQLALLNEMKRKKADLRIELEKEKTQRQALEMQRLQQELLVGKTQLEQKNEKLDLINQKLKTENLHDIKQMLINEKKIDDNFEEFTESIKNIHPAFFSKLQEQASQKLTPLDLKYCTYIFMNLSSKEIANILYVEPKTVRMAKYRLKQKLNLDKKIDLNKFIQNII